MLPLRPCRTTLAALNTGAGLCLAIAALALAACQRPAAPKTAGKAGGLALTSGAAASTSEPPTIATIEILKPEGAYQTAMPTLRWTTLPGAGSYQVRIDDSEQCTSPLQIWRTTATSQTLHYLPNGVYYICVTAFSAANAPLAAATGSFWVLAQNTADPDVQNGQGGSGAALNTPNLSAMALFQDDWDSAAINRDGGTPRPDGVAAPFGLFAFSDPGDGARHKFLVNDRGNHRVLLYADTPAYGAQPTAAVGQPDLHSGSAAASIDAASFGDNVQAAVCPDGELLVTDRARHRVLLWQQVPAESGRPADLVIGQADFTSAVSGSGPASLDQPAAAYCLNKGLYIVDRGNNRVLIYQHVPTKNGAAADLVLGQRDLNGHAPGCAANKLRGPTELLLVGGQLLVVDSDNNRVLVFNSLPKQNNAIADAVLGQDSPSSCAANRGDTVPSATTLSAPSSIAARASEIAVADAGNRRILLYPLPLSTGEAATKVVGQPTLGAHYKAEAPQIDVLGMPKGLLFDGGYLWVSDYLFKRVAVMVVP